MFYKGRTSEKFGKIHREAPVPKFFCNEVSVTLFKLKTETSAKLFTCEFYEISINSFLYNTFGQLLLHSGDLKNALKNFYLYLELQTC